MLPSKITKLILEILHTTGEAAVTSVISPGTMTRLMPLAPQTSINSVFSRALLQTIKFSELEDRLVLGSACTRLQADPFLEPPQDQNKSLVKSILEVFASSSSPFRRNSSVKSASLVFILTTLESLAE